MVSINYQTYGKGFNLRLRLYQDGVTKYVAVNKLLTGNILKRQWNQKKQCLTASAPYSEQNNKALQDFKRKYEEKSIGWNKSLEALVMEVNNTDSVANAESFDCDENVHGKPTMQQLIKNIIDSLMDNKHPDGTIKDTYEPYDKLERRLEEFCKFKHIGYGRLLVEDITPAFIKSLFDWVRDQREGKGMVYISKMLHATMGRAEQYGWFDMETLKHVRWAKRPLESSQKYHTLTDAQCKHFKALTAKELPSAPNKILYRDFCLFMLATGQSPCDVIALKYSDIKIINGVKHFVFRRRKISEKQVVPCTVPISDDMEAIMKRQAIKAQDGYVFPIRNKKKLATQTTNNGDIKKFVCLLNVWLKRLGKILGCDFPLHCYTFRHTAITLYLSKNISAMYISNMMGTSVSNCEKIYYNNRGDTLNMNKVLNIDKL